jgi:hypothetical protein
MSTAPPPHQPPEKERRSVSLVSWLIGGIYIALSVVFINGWHSDGATVGLLRIAAFHLSIIAAAALKYLTVPYDPYSKSRDANTPSDPNKPTSMW